MILSLYRITSLSPIPPKYFALKNANWIKLLFLRLRVRRSFLDWILFCYWIIKLALYPSPPFHPTRGRNIGYTCGYTRWKFLVFAIYLPSDSESIHWICKYTFSQSYHILVASRKEKFFWQEVENSIIPLLRGSFHTFFILQQTLPSREK